MQSLVFLIMAAPFCLLLIKENISQNEAIQKMISKALPILRVRKSVEYMN